MTPTILGDIGVILSAVVASVGIIVYASLATFWRSRGGWHVFWYMIVIATLLDLSVIRLAFGDTPWFAWLRAGALAIGLPFVLGWRSWIIFDLQLLRRLRQSGAYRKPDSSRPAAEEEKHGA